MTILTKRSTPEHVVYNQNVPSNCAQLLWKQFIYVDSPYVATPCRNTEALFQNVGGECGRADGIREANALVERVRTCSRAPSDGASGRRTLLHPGGTSSR